MKKTREYYEALLDLGFAKGEKLKSRGKAT